MSACSSTTKKIASAGASTARQRCYKDGDIRQQIMRRTVKGELDKDPERKGYGVLVRIDKIRGYSGFNVVQER